MGAATRITIKRRGKLNPEQLGGGGEKKLCDQDTQPSRRRSTTSPIEQLSFEIPRSGRRASEVSSQEWVLIVPHSNF